MTPESEALAFAKQRIAHFRDNEIGGYKFFQPEDNRRFVVDLMKSRASDPRTVMRDAYYRWDLAEQALREIGIEVAPGPFPKPRGPKKPDFCLRNFAIVVIVADVANRYGLDATGHSDNRRSACAVVAEALNMTYEAVAEIWRKLHRRLFTPTV